MNDMINTMTQRLLDRQPTDADYRITGKLLAALPPEIKSSPGAMAEVVLRAEHIREVKELVINAAWSAQQKINDQIPDRVDQAAVRALDAIRDHLPIDAADRMGRLLKFGALWTVMVMVIAGVGGAIFAHLLAAKDQRSRNAFNDTDFSRCVDAAASSYALGVRGGRGELPVSAEDVRGKLGSCAAEYADRRAGYS